MVADDAGRGVVWIDFSTSDTRDNGPTDRSWQEKVLVNSQSIGTAMGVQGYPAVPILFELTSTSGEEQVGGHAGEVSSGKNNVFFLFFFLSSYSLVDKKSTSDR